MNRLKNRNIYFVAIVFVVLLNFLSSDLPFFWDTLLTSTITQHFYTNGFQQLILPQNFDAGHPPLFYIYITCWYIVLGKSLFIAHLAMLPFCILGIVSFIQLMRFFSFSKTQQYVGVLLYFSIPAVLTQNTLISYDQVLLSLYLAGLVAILKNKKIAFLIIAIGIVGVTLRGLFGIAALSLTLFFIQHKNIKSWMQWNIFLLPSVAIIAFWYYYHFTQTGWWLSTNAAGWSQQRGIVDVKGLFKNFLSIARCFFDMGIVVLSILCAIYFFKIKKIDKYLWLFLIPMLLFSISFLPFTNPINHRYFLIVYVLMLLPVVQLLSSKKILFSLLTSIALFVGHFQIYPVPISNAWDCTMMYTSYLSAKDDFDNLNTRGFHIDKSKIGTVFPMNVSLYQSNMYNDKEQLINVHGKSIDSIQYVLYSNVGNDFSDEQIEQIKKWKPVAQFNRKPVSLILYENPIYNKK